MSGAKRFKLFRLRHRRAKLLASFNPPSHLLNNAIFSFSKSPVTVSSRPCQIRYTERFFRREPLCRLPRGNLPFLYQRSILAACALALPPRRLARHSPDLSSIDPSRTPTSPPIVHILLTKASLVEYTPAPANPLPPRQPADRSDHHHNGLLLRLRPADLSLRRRWLRGHRLPVPPLRQHDGRRAKGASVFHLLLHCK